jgi:hypothetical protein
MCTQLCHEHGRASVLGIAAIAGLSWPAEVEVTAMSERLQAVVAGSKAFVDALGAHLRVRLGAAPLQALTPVEAMKACTGERGLLVLEYGGPDWLEAVKKLRTARDRAALPIVAAVPSSRMAELGALQRAGVDETVRWDARVDPVLWAVDRVFAERPCAAGQRAGVRSGQPRAGVEIREAAAPDDPFAAAGALPPLLAELPPDEEVVKLLRAALAHEASPDEAWRPFTERVAAQLGDMERVALSGAPFPLDAAPLRAAACLRWRMAAVLERARATGSPPAPEITGALPVEADAALSALKALAQAAGAELQPGIEAARNALVKEAIGFTDAIAAALAPAEERRAAAGRPAERSVARVITNERAGETEARRRPVALFVALAVVVAIAAGYHANRLYRRPGPPRAHFAGAPANTIGSDQGGLKVFSVLPGRKIDSGELEQLRAAERAKGNVVKEIGPGTYVIKPEAAQTRGRSRR